MTAVIAPVVALLVSIALLQTGNGLQGTLLPVRAEFEAFSTLSIGLLGSTYYLGFVGGCLFGPHLVRRVGHIRVFTAMAALASAAPLAHGLLLMPAPWWVLRILTGFCFATLFIVIESWLNEHATKETRGSILGVYLFINLTVVTIGQLMLTVQDPNDFVLFAVASILVSLAAIPVALSVAPAPAPIESVQIRLRNVLRTSPVGFFGCFVVGATNGTFWALGPRFASASGLAVAGVAVFMSVTVLAGAAGQWPLGKYSDRIDRRKVLLGASLALAGVGALLWWHGETNDYRLFVLCAAWGFLAFPLYGVSVAHANDHAAADQFVEMSSTLLLIFAAGAVVGPLLAALLMTSFHASVLFAYTASMHLLLAGFVLWRMHKRAPVPERDHVRFIDALEAAQTVSTTFDTELEADMVSGLEKSK